MTLSIMALDTDCYAQRHLCYLSYMLSVANKLALEFVIMLNVVAPFGGGAL
jgi:hypothetical protein